MQHHPAPAAGTPATHGAAAAGVPPALALSGIVKSFGGRRVLDDARLVVAPGEVHALLGENGAGKSTLMNVLTGVYAADSGEIRLAGRPAAIRGPRDAIAAGIGMVHQHFRLVDAFSAAENLVLSAGGRRGLASRAAAAAALAAAGEAVGLAVDPNAAVGDLGVAERQRVEILKVIALGAAIVVLDEPTAVLTDREAASLIAAVRRLAAAGRSVVLITHKLREVAGHADRVTVMRAGRTVADGLPAAGLGIAELARLMVGEAAPAVLDAAAPQATAAGPALLVAAGLTASRPEGGVGIADVSLSVRAGEILGVAGVGGNGQQQLAEAILGLAAVEAGSLTIDGAAVTDAPVAARRRLGLRVIPADRMASGLVGDFSVADNLALTDGGNPLGWLDRRARVAAAAGAIADYGIAGATPGRRTRLLSGGNAQKLLVARELTPGVRVLLAHSPTRGLDVRAAAFVHAAIRAAVAGGAACLMISEDLEEILALSHRIVVMSRGRIVGERPAGASPEEIGAMMLGHA